MVASDVFLTAEELRSRWNNSLSVRTLANWRSLAEGPAFVKVGARVFYRMEDVLAWEARRRRSTGPE